MRHSLLAVTSAVVVMLAAALPAAADSSQASTGSTNVAPGGSLPINFSLELDRAQTVTVDVDVDSPGGQAIWRQQWAGQTFAAHQSRGYGTVWPVPADQATGAGYYLVVKAFQSATGRR